MTHCPNGVLRKIFGFTLAVESQKKNLAIFCNPVVDNSEATSFTATFGTPSQLSYTS